MPVGRVWNRKVPGPSYSTHHHVRAGSFQRQRSHVFLQVRACSGARDEPHVAIGAEQRESIPIHPIAVTSMSARVDERFHVSTISGRKNTKCAQPAAEPRAHPFDGVRMPRSKGKQRPVGTAECIEQPDGPGG